MSVHIKKLKIIVFPLLVMSLLLSCQSNFKKVSKSELPDKNNDSLLKYLAEPITNTVIGSYKSIEPQMMALSDTLTTYGFIGFDQTKLSTVNTRVTGRIEKLFVEYTNQKISRGQPLMEIYSPKLVSIQRNFLQAVHDKDKVLISGLKNRLQNLGMNGTEIKQVVKTQKPKMRITIYSPVDGISRDPQMSKKDDRSPNQSTILPIHKGQYVKKGETIFAIQNLSKKWAILNVFNQDLGHIKKGDSVDLYAEEAPQFVISGKINFIPPFRKKDEKTSRVRVYLKNLPKNWKIGTLIKGEIAISGKHKNQFVPLSAVNRLGIDRAVVWVQNPNHKKVFHMKKVKIGIRRGNFIQIISGTSVDDRIAENASFMIGYDSFIK